MPGFVDVSNMSDLEIKRLGQRDDDDDQPTYKRSSMYRPRYNMSAPIDQPRRPRQQPEDVTASAEVIWAAAAYADRLNGGEYRKEPEYALTETNTYTRDIVRHANKHYMWQAIKDQTIITTEDRHVGQQARDWVRKSLVIKGLRGNMSDFDRALSHAVEMDEFMTGADRYEIALVTSQIRAWREGTRLEAVMDDVIRTPVAAVDEKVQLTVQVVKSVFSTNFNVYFITAKTDGHQMVFFSYRKALGIGEWITIKGNVKAHRADATQLNRVRIVE